MTLDQLRRKISEANTAYRQGDAIMSDQEYDALLEELNTLTGGKDDLLRQIGLLPEKSDERREKLPIPMFSMNKVKNLEELTTWTDRKGIPPDALCVITPKFDGISLCVDENRKRAWTRGNGIFGQRSDGHFQMLSKSKKSVSVEVPGYTIGEVIMKKSVFQEKWKEQFKNSRNMGAGALNRKEPSEILTHFEYIRYGLITENQQEWDKLSQIQFLNQHVNSVPLLYTTCTRQSLDEQLLNHSFQEFGQEFEIDGLIIEVNDKSLRKSLGRETNSNPVFARAWKGFRAQRGSSTIKDIVYQVSKYGLLKPVAQIEPIELEGVTVSNVTLINAKYVQENSLGIGTRVEIIRSGQVIPKVIKILKPGVVNLPRFCPSCGTKTVWNENGVELVCPNHEQCEEQKIQKLLSFFRILEVDNLAEGTIRFFYTQGYTTIKQILEIRREDMEQLDTFQERKARLIYDSIQAKLKDVPLERLQHATTLFEGLGSKKLALLNRFDSAEKKPAREEVLAVEGFSEKTADIYLDNFERFWEFIQSLPVTILRAPASGANQKLADLTICFTGIRRKDLEELIQQHGGRVTSTVSGKTSHLVLKTKGSGSSKEQKALALGIPLLDVAELEALLANRLKVTER